MNLVTELNSTKQRILLVESKNSHIRSMLSAVLKRYGMELFTSSKFSSKMGEFDYYFLINERRLIPSLFTKKNVIYLFTSLEKKARHLHEETKKLSLSTTRIINLNEEEHVMAEDIDKVLWFTFSKNKESYLNLEKTSYIKEKKREIGLQKSFVFKLPSKKKIALLSVLFLILFHFIFVLPLLAGTLFYMRAYQSLMKKDTTNTVIYTQKGDTSVSLARKLYSFSRPTFLFFSIVLMPDDMLYIHEKTGLLLHSAITLQEKGQKLVGSIFKNEKSKDEIEHTKILMKDMQKEVDAAYVSLEGLYQKFPEWNAYLRSKKAQLKHGVDLDDTARKLLPYTATLLGTETDKKYLLLFANNMELRPGGGFIGSFGILTLGNYSIKNLSIYDVYDADGQLNAHIEPPEPIRAYLKQPHWFLRDSAFSPDFYENYKHALFFLEKELHVTNFDGSILLTTTSIQNILQATGNLYIPDYKEIVNQDNFYIKAQVYSEKDFFAGSIQKKKFLGSVVNQLILNIESVSPVKLVDMIKKSLDEKQIVMYFQDPHLQSLVDGYYWSGRSILPQCSSTVTNCVVDYLFPYDANLGVNKANFFVNRTSSLTVKIDRNGSITNTLRISVKNDSYGDVFPGGTYRNYMQIAIPKGSDVKKLTKNETQIESYDTKENQYKTLGFYIEIPPQTSTDIEVTYKLPSQLENGRGVYQLIVQKQIGTPNSDFVLKISLPSNIYIVNQNFTPLVKENYILYNTSLATDKIFFIELLKDVYGKEDSYTK